MFNAVVTGGTQGIGRYISEILKEMGFKPLALFKSNTEVAKQFMKETEIRAMKIDITSRYETNKIKDLIPGEIKPKILVNNAGYNIDSAFWKMDQDQWTDVIDVTLKGSYNMIQSIIEYMRKNQYGRIINISSVVSQLGVFGTTNYSAAKSGLIGLVKSLSKEVASKNITVNNLTLGYYDTGIISSVPKKHLEKIISKVPMKRLGTKEDVASAIEFLVKNNFYTGQNLNVNGGLY